MTYFHVCPRCRRVSLRATSSPRPVTCRCEYHDPQDCGLCGWCRTGLAWPPDDAQMAPPTPREPA